MDYVALKMFSLLHNINGEINQTIRCGRLIVNGWLSYVQLSGVMGDAHQVAYEEV